MFGIYWDLPRGVSASDDTSAGTQTFQPLVVCFTVFMNSGLAFPAQPALLLTKRE